MGSGILYHIIYTSSETKPYDQVSLHKQYEKQRCYAFHKIQESYRNSDKKSYYIRSFMTFIRNTVTAELTQASQTTQMSSKSVITTHADEGKEFAQIFPEFKQILKRTENKEAQAGGWD